MRADSLLQDGGVAAVRIFSVVAFGPLPPSYFAFDDYASYPCVHAVAPRALLSCFLFPSFMCLLLVFLQTWEECLWVGSLCISLLLEVPRVIGWCIRLLLLSLVRNTVNLFCHLPQAASVRIKVCSNTLFQLFQPTLLPKRL